MSTVSTVTLVLVLVSTLLNVRYLGDILLSRAVFAMVLFVLGSFAIGYLIASPHPERRVVLGLGTAQRNIAAATVVAAEDFRGPGTLIFVVVASVLDLFVLIPLARWLRRRSAGAATPTHDPSLAASRARA